MVQRYALLAVFCGLVSMDMSCATTQRQRAGQGEARRVEVGGQPTVLVATEAQGVGAQVIAKAPNGTLTMTDGTPVIVVAAHSTGKTVDEPKTSLSTIASASTATALKGTGMGAVVVAGMGLQQAGDAHNYIRMHSAAKTFDAAADAHAGKIKDVLKNDKNLLRWSWARAQNTFFWLKNRVYWFSAPEGKVSINAIDKGQAKAKTQFDSMVDSLKERTDTAVQGEKGDTLGQRMATMTPRIKKGLIQFSGGLSTAYALIKLAQRFAPGVVQGVAQAA